MADLLPQGFTDSEENARNLLDPGLLSEQRMEVLPADAHGAVPSRCPRADPRCGGTLTAAGPDRAETPRRARQRRLRPRARSL